MFETDESNRAHSSTYDNAYSIILFDIQKHWMFCGEGESYSLSNAEIERIEGLLRSKIAAYNAGQMGLFERRKIDFPHMSFMLSDYTIQLQDYKRQYLAAKTKEGPVVVFVQFLCRVEGHAWQKELIVVKDGGKCYFELKINLQTNTVYDFRVNGEA